ncbi:hypothetical protein SAMN05444672_103136 [Bacillus sp. OK838]|nr:hypothetical protein SAMN05444672_103136 [Bacillus sp. OK838]
MAEALLVPYHSGLKVLSWEELALWQREELDGTSQ